MAEVKGVLLSAIRTFLNDRYGKEAVERAVTELNPAEGTLVQKRFLESSFYPYEAMLAMGNLTRACGKTRRTTGQELGKYLADYVFKGPYKPLLAQDTPLMVRKVSWLKDFFYRDANTVESSQTSDSSGIVVYRYVNGVRPTRGVCRSLGSFWGHALELAGGVTIKGSHPNCVAEGGDRCEFQYKW